MRTNRLLVAGIFVLLLIGAVAAGIFLSSDNNTPPAASDVDINTAEAYLESGEYEKARDALQKIVEHDEDNADAYFMLGLAHFNLGLTQFNNQAYEEAGASYQEAQAAFLQALELDSGRAGAVHHNLGAIDYQMGDLAGALEEFELALESDPNDADTHYQMDTIYMEMAFPQNVVDPAAVQPNPEVLAQAEEEFETALELAPNKPEPMIGLGYVYLMQGDFDQAVEVLEEVVEQYPQMREGLFALGRAYIGAGELDEARTALESFLETDPPQAWARQAQDLLAALEE